MAGAMVEPVVSPYPEPYVEVYGFYQNQKPKTYFFPVLYNDHLETFQAEGMHGLRIVKIVYHWKNKEKDILEMKRHISNKERQEWKQAKQQYEYSRIVRKGRAQQDESLLARYYDNYAKRPF